MIALHVSSGEVESRPLDRPDAFILAVDKINNFARRVECWEMTLVLPERLFEIDTRYATFFVPNV